MFRWLLRLLILGGIALVAAPFVLSSLYIDQRGITIPGKVHSRSEFVRTQDTTWSRECQVSIEYSPPDGAGVAFTTATLDTASYDALHKGQNVSLHYLPARDIPRLPMAATLSQMHMLPVARLAGQRAFSGFDRLLHGPGRRVLDWMIAFAVLLAAWRFAGWRHFKWAVVACVLVGLGALMYHDFPAPTPAPSVEVRRGQGKVASVDLIDRFFETRRSHGFDAAQPIQVVGIEFVPEGRADSVVAVDLIDARPSLKTGAPVAVEYEAGSPRTAYLRGATRTFYSRNIRGIAVEAILCLAVVAALLAAFAWAGNAWNRLITRR